MEEGEGEDSSTKWLMLLKSCLWEASNQGAQNQHRCHSSPSPPSLPCLQSEVLASISGEVQQHADLF